MSKLSCNIVRDLLPLYVDGVLEKESIEEIKEHLQTCAECRELFETMKSDVIPTAKEAPTIQIPELKNLLKRIKMQNLIIAGIVIVILVLFFAPLWKIPTEEVVWTRVSIEAQENIWEPGKPATDYLMVDYEYDLYSGMHMNFYEKDEGLYITGHYSLFSILMNWGQEHTTSGGYGQPIKNADDIKAIYFNGEEIWNFERDGIKKD